MPEKSQAKTLTQLQYSYISYSQDRNRNGDKALMPLPLTPIYCSSVPYPVIVCAKNSIAIKIVVRRQL